jgi:S-(hydroxymethyl)glutathione synthase
MAIIAVVEKNAFKILQGNEKIQNFDTKPTCHRKFCKVCGCHMFLYVDGFPDFVLIHVPTLDRAQDVGKRPDRWVFVNSKHPLLVLPEDGLPRHPGWAPTASA